MSEDLKPLEWVTSARKDLMSFPEQVRREVGFALYRAQEGKKHIHAKPLKEFGGAGVLEVVTNNDGNTYRAVYTVRFAEKLYVLHCFQKKSKSGISTPKQEIELVRTRLKIAESEYKKWQESQKSS